MLQIRSLFASSWLIGSLVLASAVGACGAKVDGESDPPASSGNGGVVGSGGRAGSGGAGGSGNEAAGGAAGMAPPHVDAGASAATGGTDGGGIPSLGAPFPALPDSSTVVISEVMYHPVQENSDNENHEFIELFNRSKNPVALDGWKLETGGMNPVAFTFPAGTQIMPGQYRVVAKNRKLLAAVAKYGLAEADVLGDYTGELDNGGATLSLKNQTGTAVDMVKYDDKIPWPISPDALGVAEEFLPKDQQPISKHQYIGRSLERINTDIVSNEAANWDASALDGPTPGKANSVTGVPLPVLTTQEAAPLGGKGPIIRAQDSAAITAKFSPYGTTEMVELESFVDDVAKTGEPTAVTPMTFNPTDRSFNVTLPPRPENSIVRYRFRATRGGKATVISPRPTDPYAWHAYFVTPDVKSATRTFHMFISPANWTQLEKWLAPGRASGDAGCSPNVDWQSEVPATFVSDGHVFDAYVRYEGSRFQRKNGAPIPKWTAPGPTLPAGQPLLALSWRIKLPKYDPLDGTNQMVFNKMYQGCPGTVTRVESRLLENAKFPSYHSTYARLHINGAYYHYFSMPEDIDDKMMKRYLGAGEAVGEMYKDDGLGGDEGVIGKGDFSPITAASCSGKFPILQRYEATYARVNYSYRSGQEIAKLITDLDVARKAGISALRTYFMTYWDVDAMLTMYAIRNWAGVWDDTFHNLFPYKRSDGKWLGLQQDYEWDFGLGQFGSDPSLAPWQPKETFYIGLDPAQSDAKITKQCELDPVADKKWIGNCNLLGFSRLKDGFIRTFKTEFDNKLKELDKTVLNPAQVLPLIDEEIAAFNLDDWNADPTDKKFCDVKQRHDSMKAWTNARHATLVDRLKP